MKHYHSIAANSAGLVMLSIMQFLHDRIKTQKWVWRSFIAWFYSGIVDSMLASDIVICEFDLQSRTNIHFRTNTLITQPPVKGLNSTTNVSPVARETEVQFLVES